MRGALARDVEEMFGAFSRALFKEGKQHGVCEPIPGEEEQTRGEEDAPEAEG